MQDEFMVSVCIPTYNHKEWLTKCLNAVFSQKTNFSFEILVGLEYDDTESEKYINPIEDDKINFKIIRNTEERLIYINSNRTGRGNTINLLQNVKGKYVAFCEGDDYWTDPYKLQKQVDFLETNDEYVACYGGCMHVDSNNQVIKKTRFEEYNSPNSEMLLTAQGAMITNSVMFRNVISNFPDFFKHVPSGDTILYHLLGFHGHGKFLPEIKFSAYRIHNTGLWSGSSDINRMKNTLMTLVAIKNNLSHYFGEDHTIIYKMNYSAFKNINGYLYKNLYSKNFKEYFKLIIYLLKQNSFSKSFLLKEHFIDLFQRVFKKK